MSIVSKEIFLNTLSCPTLGWLNNSQPAKQSESISDNFRIEEGLEIHQKARSIFNSGHLIKGDNVSATKKTQEMLNDKSVSVIFEATFIVNGFVTKADILKREESGWHLIETKSKVKNEKEIKGKDKEDLIDDIAYTGMVITQTGLNITKYSLMLISKDYRLEMPDEELFTEIDYTDEVLARIKEFNVLCNDVIHNISAETRPAPKLKWECRNCELFEDCLKQGIENHIFDLPRLSEKKFSSLVNSNILRIEDIPEDFELTTSQIKVRDSVKNGRAIINKHGLKVALGSIVFPIYNLDFETVQTAIPLYPNIAPYEQIPIQYSIHVCSSPDKIVDHFEYLADPSKDCRRELAEKLIIDCGVKGSIIVYTSFEKTRINNLIELFPDLKEKLEALIERIIDINKMISDNLYHPEFHGSYSIKVILPVLVPGLTYDNMDVSNGLDASATFAYLAKKKYDQQEAREKRKKLLEYCKLDTMAMVKLHEQLIKYE